MDKLEKIHIARVAYNIDVTAEANLQKYLKAIRTHLDADTADEVMEDIESRIPEILTERKIKQNDIITETDVEAVKEQLGDPGLFSDSQSQLEYENKTKKYIDTRRQQ